MTACRAVSTANALALVAAALNSGDRAMAAIATVQMQIPDLPSLGKGPKNPDNIARRARELARSGLLKFWDPALHPRTGVPPNPSWFAPVASDGDYPSIVPVSMPDEPDDRKLQLLDGSGGEDDAPSEPERPEPQLRH